MHVLVRKLTCLACLFVGAACPADEPPAAESLRWHFQQGAAFRLRITQNVQQATIVGEKTTAANVTTALEMVWKIEQLDAEGNARIRHSFQRMFLKGERPDGQTTTYDSAAPEQADAQAKAKARQLGPLQDCDFLVTLTPRGEILSVTATPETESRLSDPESGRLAQRVTTTAFVESLLRPSLGILPAKPVQPGDRWSQDRQVESAEGKLAVTDHYRFEGIESTAEGRLARIRMVIHAQTDETDAATQPGGGEFLFDIQAGRLLRSELSGSLSYETPYRDTKIQVQTTSATKLRVEPL